MPQCSFDLTCQQTFGKLAPVKTYLIYIKATEGPQKPLKIKASGHTVDADGKLVRFEEQAGNIIAVFNIAELIGFVESEHVVN